MGVNLSVNIWHYHTYSNPVTRDSIIPPPYKLLTRGVATGCMFNPSMGVQFRDSTFALWANCAVSES